MIKHTQAITYSNIVVDTTYCKTVEVYAGLNTIIWVNYNDLTATSLEEWLVMGTIPKIALFQVSELL